MRPHLTTERLHLTVTGLLLLLCVLLTIGYVSLGYEVAQTTQRDRRFQDRLFEEYTKIQERANRAAGISVDLYLINRRKMGWLLEEMALWNHVTGRELDAANLLRLREEIFKEERWIGNVVEGVRPSH